MNTRKWIVLAALLSTVLLGLPACSSGGGGDTDAKASWDQFDWDEADWE